MIHESKTFLKQKQTNIIKYNYDIININIKIVCFNELISADLVHKNLRIHCNYIRFI